MTGKNFTLKYGKGTLSFEIPADRLLYELVGSNLPAVSDLAQDYLYALDHPIDSAPLSERVKPGERVAIVVSDITRAWQRNDETLPLLIDYLNRAGIRDRDIIIIIGVGAHRPNTRDEFVELCSREICHRVRVVNHDAWQIENMVYLGKTSRGTEVAVNRIAAEADRLILTGGVIYHYMAGFGGGRKSILPGVAALKTIQQNHLLALTDRVGGGTNPKSASAVTTGNSMHEDMMEIAAFAKPDFLINVVPNLDGDIAGIFTGNWVSAWLQACQLVEEIYGVIIEEKADIVIVSAGGYPRDINLYQSQKTIDNDTYAMKTGGVAIILAQCPLIQDPPEFFEWFENKDLYSLEKAARENFLISGWLAVRQLEYKQMGSMILVTDPANLKLAAKAHMEPVVDMTAALELAYARCENMNPTITVMPQGANTLPIFKGGSKTA
ncbi:MAG: nickel-dependent lactate racemase [Desulfobacterales bacterium]